MPSSLRRTIVAPLLAAGLVAGGATAATAVEVPSPGVPQLTAAQTAQAGQPTGHIAVDGVPRTHADYRENLMLTVSFPGADPAVQDYVQLFVNGQAVGPAFPLDAHGSITLPLYMSMGHHFVSAVLIEDGYHVSDALNLQGFSVTAPLPGEPGSPVPAAG